MELLKNKKYFLIFILISILGLIVRFFGRDFLSADAWDFLLPWFWEIKDKGGLAALQYQVGNYNIPYQFIIALLTYIPFDPLYMYKTVSVIFDYVLAFAGAQFVYFFTDRKREIVFLFAYMVILLLPTHVMNSSVWAQCDSIYVSFIILSLLLLYKNYDKMAFVCLGAAFAFKLQTIFIVPFFGYCYFLKRKFNVCNFFLMITTFYILCLPGLLCGRSFLDPLKVYFEQSDTYHSMWLNFPSFWTVLGIDNYEMLSMIGILIAFTVLGIGLLYVVVKKITFEYKENYLMWAIWTVWTCLLFLPAMHERYGYLLDILLLLLVFYRKKYLIYLCAPIVSSVLTYGAYLFEWAIPLRWCALLYTLSYFVYTYSLLKTCKKL